ncbi:MAG: purine-binding chemotaxis protein CheW [Polyangiaceae bacterium]|nr:purine-binding chemotaxis protein CheW [Polyangiaceae bacterium]
MEPAQPTRAKSAPRCIAVVVRGSLYGVRVEEVQEVIGLRPLTRVFHAPDELAGVISLRGEVLPVLDVGALLAGPAQASSPSPDARIVVVRESRAPRRRAGLLVDELGGLRDVPDAGLEPLPSTASEAVRQLVVGVIATAPPCGVLDVSALFDSEPIARLSGGEAET